AGVAGPVERAPHRADAAAAQTPAGLEAAGREQPGPVQVGRQLEAVGRLLGPAAELVPGREPIAGGVQLDGREPLAVERQELGRLEPGRIEAGPPPGIGPARRADVHAHAPLPSGIGSTVRGPLATRESVTLPVE